MAVINIPIETKVREFDGKLWLAVNLANEGHKVALGEKNRVGLFDEIRPHLHITGGKNYDIYDDLTKAGTNIAWLDTEGGVFDSPDDYIDRVRYALINNKNPSNINAIFAWGEAQAKLIQDRTLFEDEQIYVTGNPRFDLVHPQLRDIYAKPAKNLLEKYGEFILINTNFTYANSFNDEHLKEKLNKGVKNESQKKLKYQQHLLNEFIKAIKKLNEEFPTHHIIVRPHPSEDHDFYSNKFEQTSSVSVRFSGDVRTWIYAADCVIHNGCTTGIEAAMLNTPVIAYEPNHEFSSYHPPLPNVVSSSAHSVQELTNKLQEFISDSGQYQMSTLQSEELKRYFENCDQLSVPKFVQTISEIDNLKNDRPLSSYGSVKRRFERWVKNQPTAPIVSRIRDFSGFGRSSYEKQKFPGLTIEEVQSRICDFEDQIGEMNLKVKPLNNFDDIYWIENK